MHLLQALLSCILFAFALGLVWPRSGAVNLPQYLVETSGKALWLSWFVFCLTFWVGLGDLSLVLIAMVVIAVAVLSQRKALPEVHLDSRMLAWLTLTALALAASINLPALSYLRAGGFSLSGWDINASWNRWALELVEGEYRPYNAAYPIFIPAIWSLIYKAQGSIEVWILPKIFLIAFLILPALLASALLVLRRYLAALVIIFVVWGNFLQKEHLLAGIMDPLVMMLGLVAGAMLYISMLPGTKQGKDAAILSACMFAGIAAATKQSGIAVAAVVFIAAIYMGISYCRSWRWHFVNAATAFAPVASFMLIFMSSGQSAIGNIGDLAALSDRAGQGAVVQNAWLNLTSMMGGPALFALVSCAGLNLFRIRYVRHRIGLLFLIGAIAGFFAYARCCSYDERNGWFLVCLLATSAMFGVSMFEVVLRSLLARLPRILPASSVKFRQAGTLAALGLVAGAFGAAFAIGESRLTDIGVALRKDMVWPSVNDLLYSANVPDKVISSYPFVHLLPGFETRSVQCATDDCARAAIEQHPGSVLLMGTDGFDYPELRANLPAASIAKVEYEHGFSVTVPLHPSNLKPIAN